MDFAQLLAALREGARDPRRLILKLALVLLPAAGVLGPVVALLLKQYNLVLLSLYMAIPMVLAPVIYSVYKRGAYRESFAQSSGRFSLLIVGYAVLFVASLFVLYFYDVRPTGYYFLIAAVATIVLLEIIAFDVSSPKRTSAVLLQITLLGNSLIWGVTLKYYYFIGRTDVPVHIFYVDTILTVSYTHLRAHET